MSYMKVEGDPTTVLINNSYSPDTTPDIGGVAMRQEVGTVPGPAYYERQRRNRAARDEFLYLMAPTSVLALVGGVRVVYRLCRWLGRGTLYGVGSCLVSAWDGHRMFFQWWRERGTRSYTGIILVCWAVWCLFMSSIFWIEKQ